MDGWAASAGVVAGLGLVVLGERLASAAGHSTLGRITCRLAPRCLTPLRSWAAGLATAAVPASPAHPRALVALASAGVTSLDVIAPAALGGLFSVAITAGVMALAIASGGFASALGTLAGVSALALAAGRGRGWAHAARTLAGWGGVGLGARLLAAGLRGADGAPTVRFDALPLPVAGQVAVVLVAGVALAAGLRSVVPLLALATAGVATSAVNPTSAVALCCAALVASGVDAWLVAPTERIGGRRAALGTGLTAAVAGMTGLFSLTLALPFVVAWKGTGDPASLRLAAFVALHVALVNALVAPFRRALWHALEERVDGDGGVGACSLDLPELILAGAEERLDRSSFVLRMLARGILANEHVTAFRLEQDVLEVRTLALELEDLWVRAGTQELESRAARRLTTCARAARLFPLLVDELFVLRCEAGQQDAHLPSDVHLALHERQVALLHLFESALAEGVGERLEALRQDAESLEGHLTALEHHLLGVVARGGMSPDLALALQWRQSRLRSMTRTLLELAAALATQGYPAVEVSWSGLARYAADGVRALRAARQGGEPLPPVLALSDERVTPAYEEAA